MKLIVCLLTTIRLLLDYLIRPLAELAYGFYYRNIDKPNPLPKIKNPLLLLPAHRLAQKIRSREITSLESVQAYIDRIKEIQPLVNCVVKDCYEEALEEARRVDDLFNSDTILEKYSEKNAPLLGVPFSCKESFWVKGMPNSTGIVARKDFRAPQDADVVRYMREAGAIMTCLTNTSEGCMWLESSNYLYGTTRNPYNLSRIVGGSSGGEGCVIGGAGSVIGIGSDIGGSIRMPSYFNGIYGHKPSSNLISNKFQHPPAKNIQDEMLASGPMCRYASDLRLLFKIFIGPRYNEVASNFESFTDLKKLKYYYIKDLQGNLLVSNLSSNTKNALNKAISFVEKNLEVSVKEIKLPKLKEMFQIWSAMINNGETGQLAFSRLLTDTNRPINAYMELLKAIFLVQNKHTLPALSLALVETLPMKNLDEHIKHGKEIKQELQSILGDDGILLFPSFPVVAPHHNQALITNTFDFIYYGTFNAFGLPVTQCPMGLSEKEGLPTGVQIVANHKQDHLTIKLAEYFESNLIGWVEPS